MSASGSPSFGDRRRLVIWLNVIAMQLSWIAKSPERVALYTGEVSAIRHRLLIHRSFHT